MTDDKPPGMTVGQLRAALYGVPDSAGILVEDNGGKYTIAQVWTVGIRTEDPGVIARLLRIV